MVSRKTTVPSQEVLQQAKEFMTSSRQALRWVWQELTRIKQETEHDDAELAEHLSHFDEYMETLAKKK